MRGQTHGGNVYFTFAPSRSVMSEYAIILKDESLHDMATNDLFWDRVVEVAPCGEDDVYDLTVPGLASWLADGIVSHNSGALEQDSDLVLFLYRDEIYNPTSDKSQGLAEVIVGKHRNGPTGSVTLRFTKEFTRFDNYTPRAEPF
jgi:replicative DNA helicase